MELRPTAADPAPLCVAEPPAPPPTSVWRASLAEGIGTLALVFAGTGAIVVEAQTGALGHVGVALTFGLVVMAAIYAVGEVSGAHINPAVTIAFWASGRFPASHVGPYVLAQFAGALVASGLLWALFPAAATLGATVPTGSAVQSLVLEGVLTFFLMFVILGVAVGAKEVGLLAGVAIGGTVAFEALMGGPVSGASMNPARSLGPALVSLGDASFDLAVQWVYVAGPLLGALLAVPAYRAVYADPHPTRPPMSRHAEPPTASQRTAPEPAALPFQHRDVIVVGGGQAALAVGYHLTRALRDKDATFALFDDQSAPGGAWRHGWDSLRLFSPAEWSSLPGYLLPRHLGERYAEADVPEYPHRDDVLDYLAAYEARYDLPVWRPVRVRAVRRVDEDPSTLLRVETDRGDVTARAVVSATGTWARPVVPDIPERERFAGEQIHSSAYRTAAPFAGRRVLVVGEGNSGAQILAEVSAVARASWVTLHPPRFLPPDVDGRVLFDAATARYESLRAGRDPARRPPGLGDVVQVPPVRGAREAGRLSDVRPSIARFTRGGVVWPDGTEEAVDAVIWCTGFRPALDHLAPLGVVGTGGRVEVEGTRSVAEPRLWLVGYGSWTGFASATLVGVGRTARATASEIAASLSPPEPPTVPAAKSAPAPST